MEMIGKRRFPYCFMALSTLYRCFCYGGIYLVTRQKSLPKLMGGFILKITPVIYFVLISTVLISPPATSQLTSIRSALIPCVSTK